MVTRNKEDLMADLEYASQMARSGENSPLVGGPIGLMWGLLLSGTFLIQWGVLSGTLGWPQQSLGLLWLAFAIIGGLGCAIMGPKVARKPGAQSVANRVETYVWVMFTGMMATLFIGIMLSMLFGNGDYKLFDLMLIVGFSGQGLAYGVVAKMSKMTLLHIASFLGFMASAVSFMYFGTAEIYLIGSVATVFTIIIPSLLLMQKGGRSDAR